MSVPTLNEVKDIIRKKRNASTPGRSGINYLVYKRLPPALYYLHQVIKTAWLNIPVSWAEAAVVLLFKDGDHKNPKNYRPIALTDCAGKVFFSIWAKRLESFMQNNDFFKRSKQKGFLHGISGCLEHIETLKAVLKHAKSKHRQVVVAWLDLKNAFGSVSHNLIQFALHWYHLPDKFAKLIFMYYNVLVASIVCDDWSSKPFAYEIGVFQGCVISPILFNMVFNLLLDILLPYTVDHGYKLTPTLYVHDLAYADDLSIIARDAKKCQLSLDVIDDFLSWTRTMAAKPIKCKSLAYKQWTPNDNKKYVRLLNNAFTPFDPKLRIAGETIAFITEHYFKFLGWKVYHDLSEKKQKQQIFDEFCQNMSIVDSAYIHGFMKAWIYQHYVVPKLAWYFMVYELDVSYAGTLQNIANKYLKSWFNLYRNAIVSILYRPRSEFGLQLHSIVSFYKKLQVIKSLTMKHSKDLGLQEIYACISSHQKSLSRVWRPGRIVDQLEFQVNHDLKFKGQFDKCGLGAVIGRYSRQALLSTRKRKTLLMEKLSDALSHKWRMDDINKDLQGCYHRFGNCLPFDLSWKHLLCTKNPKMISWVLNASLNSVVTPDLRKLWGYVKSAVCPLCDHTQASLSHILSNCTRALAQRRYSWRHDSVLATLEVALLKKIEEVNKSPIQEKRSGIHFVRSIENQTQQTGKRITKGNSPKSCGTLNSSLLCKGRDWNILTDYLKKPVGFPAHICPSNKRPDIVLYSDSSKQVILIELTCPIEENINTSHAYKIARYHSLKSQISSNGWNCALKCIEVGARGFVGYSALKCLRSLGFQHSKARSICKKLSKASSICSQAIYNCHHAKHWVWSPLVTIQ
jgi:hypothetical protein